MNMTVSHDILKSDIRVYFELNINIGNRILVLELVRIVSY